MNDCSLNNIQMEIEPPQDSYGVELARYDYPYVDGTAYESLGQKGREITFRCWFWDDGGSHATFDGHRELLQLLESREPLTFRHPSYGAVPVWLSAVTARVDEAVRAAALDITLLEQFRQPQLVLYGPPVVRQAEGALAAALPDLEALLNEEMTAALSTSEAATLMTRPLDEALTLAEQFGDLSRTARAYVRDLDTILARFAALAVEITQPVTSLTATLNFAATLPGRVIGTITFAVERVARLYDATINFPARFLDSLYVELLALEETLELFAATPATPACLTQFRVAAGYRLGLEAAAGYQADEDRRDLVRQAEQTPAFDLLGRPSAPFDFAQGPVGERSRTQVMTVTELEQSLAQVRTALQRGITAARGQAGLKELAQMLLAHVYTTKLERERIIEVLVRHERSLHLVCRDYGLAYRYADRIMSINRIPNPNYTSGTVQIYGR